MKQIKILINMKKKIDKDVIYTAGTDTKLSKFIKNNSGKWNFQVGRKRHTHDISAIAVINRGEEEMIITGGIDTKLIVHDISKDLGHIVLPFSQNFQFAANRSKKLVFHQSLQLKIWNLGSGILFFFYFFYFLFFCFSYIIFIFYFLFYKKSIRLNTAI